MSINNPKFLDTKLPTAERFNSLLVWARREIRLYQKFIKDIEEKLAKMETKEKKKKYK